MKLIALMLTRNEAHILPTTLAPLTKICDHIIVADQQSEDGTQDIVQSFPNTTLIHNNTPPPPQGRFDIDGRNLLLDAARNFDGNNLMLCLDADELISPILFKNFKNDISQTCKAGIGIRMPWIQLFQKAWYHRPRANVFYHSKGHQIAFYDDRKARYDDNAPWIHNFRIPKMSKRIHKNEFKILHLHWLFLEKAKWQQVWYHMAEFQHASFNRASALRINHFYYDPTLNDAPYEMQPIPAAWHEGCSLPPSLPDSTANWRKDSVMNMFDQHGMKKFEPLNIWFIPELKKRFENKYGHEPCAYKRGFHTINRIQPYLATITRKNIVTLRFITKPLEMMAKQLIRGTKQ